MCTGWYGNMCAFSLLTLAACVSWLAYFTSEVGTPAPISSTNLRKAGPGPGSGFGWFSLMWSDIHWLEQLMNDLYINLTSWYPLDHNMYSTSSEPKVNFASFSPFLNPRASHTPNPGVTDLLRSNVQLHWYPNALASQVIVSTRHRERQQKKEPVTASSWQVSRLQERGTRWRCKLSSRWNIWKTESRGSPGTLVNMCELNWTWSTD